MPFSMALASVRGRAIVKLAKDLKHINFGSDFKGIVPTIFSVRAILFG